MRGSKWGGPPCFKKTLHVNCKAASLLGQATSGAPAGHHRVRKYGLPLQVGGARKARNSTT